MGFCDDDLQVKFADFQGRQPSENGEVLLDGWSGEPTLQRYYRGMLAEGVRIYAGNTLRYQISRENADSVVRF